MSLFNMIWDLDQEDRIEFLIAQVEAHENTINDMKDLMFAMAIRIRTLEGQPP